MFSPKVFFDLPLFPSTAEKGNFVEHAQSVKQDAETATGAIQTTQK